MNKQEYYQFVQQTFADMLKLIERKNKDYSGPGDDPFSNFRRSQAVGVEPIKGLTVRLLDKVARIESYMQAGKLENEGIDDSFKDLIGYSCLALGMLEEIKHEVKIIWHKDISNV